MIPQWPPPTMVPAVSQLCQYPDLGLFSC